VSYVDKDFVAATPGQPDDRLGRRGIAALKLPKVTLTFYERLFGNTDERAATAIETALAGTLG
jgi:hypothetical protein